MSLSRRQMLLGAVALIAACKPDSPLPSPPPTSPPSPSLPPPSPPPPPPPPTAEVSVPFSFANGLDGFTADFAEYSPGQETGTSGIGFVSEFQRLPPPLNNRFGLLVAGTNRSDDLFMYIYRPISGLVPRQRYQVRVDITFATNVPPECLGVGGSPGEGVAIKAGATSVEPTKRVENDRVVTSIDKGNQATSGREMILIGNFAGGEGTCTEGRYALKTLSTASPPQLPTPPPAPPTDALLLTADSAGRLWVVVGTDSGFESRTEIYFLEGAATFTPA